MHDLASLAEKALLASEGSGGLVNEWLMQLDMGQTCQWLRALSTTGKGFLLLSQRDGDLIRSLRVHDEAAAQGLWPELDLSGATWVTVDAVGMPWARVVHEDFSATETSADGRVRQHSLADLDALPASARDLMQGTIEVSLFGGIASLHPDPKDAGWAQRFDCAGEWTDGFHSTEWSGYVGDRMIGVAARKIHHAQFAKGMRPAWPVLGLALVSV